jgi:Zn-dependent protease with chaperone function
MDAPTQGPGSWFDGVSGAPQQVTVALEDTALAIASAQGTTRWDYAALERLPAPEHRLRLGLAKSASTARLEVRDPAFAEVVKARLDVRTIQVEASERRRRHRVVEWSIAGVVAVVLIGAVGLPSLAELLLPLIPRSAETPLGETAHAMMKASVEQELRKKSNNAPFDCGEQGEKERAGRAVFLKMFRKLESAAELPITVRPFIARTDTVNAVALPGGFVHVFNGIIAELQSPDELGGVIAHELGHVAHRDAMRGVLHATGVSFLFGIALGDVMGSGGMTTAAQQILNNRHTRLEEAGADTFSTQVMRKLGADPHAFANMFERFMRAQRPSRNMRLLYDHPANADRVAAIRATPAVANPTPLLTQQEWQALKQACSGS